jgi:uncharacterized protein (TIGR00251 family)
MSAAGDNPWRLAGGGVILRVRVTPKASKDAVEGIEATAEGPALKVRVRAVPEDGEANAAVEKLVAAWLGLPRRAVELVGGGKSRVKSLMIVGDAAAIVQRLGSLSGV